MKCSGLRSAHRNRMDRDLRNTGGFFFVERNKTCTCFHDSEMQVSRPGLNQCTTDDTLGRSRRFREGLEQHLSTISDYTKQDMHWRLACLSDARSGYSESPGKSTLGGPVSWKSVVSSGEPLTTFRRSLSGTRPARKAIFSLFFSFIIGTSQHCKDRRIWNR
jgi:hypothetical protein